MRRIIDASKRAYDIIIVGGGLAGLTAGIHLSKGGLDVLIVEKHSYPKHKVCGEYVSNEVLPYLLSLGFDPFIYGAKAISKVIVSTRKSKSISADLPLGGFGISRYCMDAALADLAVESSANILHATVSHIAYAGDRFTVQINDLEVYTANFVIGAYGKRAALDVKLGRDFIRKSSPFLAVKAHYRGEFPADEVHLHNFEGGYCGLSQVETGTVNVCYITDYRSFKRHKDLEDFQRQVMMKNTILRDALESMEMVFDKPLTISQISFESKQVVDQHILMCGDTAGLIHPLAGNGMSMAIRAAAMLSTIMLRYYDSGRDRRQVIEKTYILNWNQEFQSRLRTGHLIAKLFRSKYAADIMQVVASVVPGVLPAIIRRTHGSMMKI